MGYKLCSLSYRITQKSMNDMLKMICHKVSIEDESLNVNMYTCWYAVVTKYGNTPEMLYS